MATIQISDIQADGRALFADSESYLSDLTADEMTIAGGVMISCIPPLTTFPITITITPLPLPFPKPWPPVFEMM
jgi:hypothetical protein